MLELFALLKKKITFSKLFICFAFMISLRSIPEKLNGLSISNHHKNTICSLFFIHTPKHSRIKTLTININFNFLEFTEEPIFLSNKQEVLAR